MFDGESDISVSLKEPDEIIIANNARASTLRLLDVKIVRADTSERAFNFDVSIPAGEKETVKIDDFVIQKGDKAVVTNAVFSWDM
jgi:hypothetical protein